MSTYKAITLVQRPHDRKIGPHLFETKELEVPTPKDGQILIKQTHMSLDPAMLGWMSEDRESYIPPVELGDVMRSSGVGEVVESKNPDFSVGDKVMGMTGWSEYVLSDGSGFNKLQDGV
ncbi:MAG: NADP-dependent oxidoreductase, partial [Pseudomonadota bacterium]|nr:NADP-dependent oxidoreductase [Pseudomonadota bacterium]